MALKTNKMQFKKVVKRPECEKGYWLIGLLAMIPIFNIIVGLSIILTWYFDKEVYWEKVK